MDAPIVTPAVVVHGFDHAVAVLRLRPGATLLSAAWAGRYAGAPWWQAMVAAARAAYPGDGSDILDCGEAPGAAMAALRLGQRALVLAPVPAFATVSAVAATLGARVFSTRPDALDLAWPRAERQLAAWLRVV